MRESRQGAGIELRGPTGPGYERVLTPEALAFVASLAHEFEPARRHLLTRRRRRLEEIRAGRMPDFLPETRGIRDADWRGASIPDDLMDRRVEITGPVDAKMIINALNSGANVFMADFEDATSPTWRNVVEGQIHLIEAVRGTLTHTSPEGKRYAVNPKRATLMVRPRGWHMVEKHALIDSEPVSASLFDFGLFFFHNARELLKRGTGPYFYLPKMESHLEARLWNDVFVRAQETLRVPQGSIRATVLIETIPAAFEMDEILYELRAHSAGLNCGRWDYIFSFIKKFSHRPDFILPDRAKVTMDRPFLDAYVKLLIKTCHRRGVHALGGMAAHIPIKNDPAASEQALARVREDKMREVRAGHDGTWVAHPGLIPVAKEIFDRHMKTPNQIQHARREDVRVTAVDLLAVPTGDITEEGARHNVRVGIQYLEAWLGGTGCVPLYHLMEDAATAEISRSQLWQWVRHGQVSRETMQAIIADEAGRLHQSPRLETARQVFTDLIFAEEFPEFLTLAADSYLD